MEKATDKQMALMVQLGIPYTEGTTKKEAIKLIGEKMGKGPKTTNESKPVSKKSDNSSYYVAYAKDLVIAMLPQERFKTYGLSQLMNDAIEAIEKAKEKFE